MSGNATDLFAGGTRSTGSIVNYFSAGGVSANDVNASQSTNAREVLSGALTAATLTTVLSITGAGSLAYLSAYTKDTTTRTVRLVVIADGVTVFDATTNSIAVALRGLIAAGCIPSTATPGGAAVYFSQSCSVRVASSLSETDKVAIAYQLETKQ